MLRYVYTSTFFYFVDAFYLKKINNLDDLAGGLAWPVYNSMPSFFTHLL